MHPYAKETIVGLSTKGEDSDMLECFKTGLPGK
jgi:hypothetical protein